MPQTPTNLPADTSAPAGTCRRDPPGCGLYIHVPFCETKCGYCDFFSVAVKDRKTIALVERLIRELELRLPGDHPEITTIFVGGGTPTILPVDELASLLSAVSRMVPPDAITEYTVEANPATVDDAKTIQLIEGGVTRISLGAQSFSPQELVVLERIHSPDDIRPSVETIRRHAPLPINLDLIFGIPGQSLVSWGESLRRTIELAPEHIACYGLTYEPNTRLTAIRNTGRLTPCDEYLEADMYLMMVETLAAAGYQQYEISNFAQPGFACLHNLGYWRNRPYVGVGPSAAGCINGRRYKNIADVNGYIRAMDDRGCAEAESEIIDQDMLILEMLMMQLRLVEGLSFEEFRSRTGCDPPALFNSELTRFRKLGLIAVSDTHVALTPQGRLVANAVIADLAAAADRVAHSSRSDARR